MQHSQTHRLYEDVRKQLPGQAPESLYKRIYGKLKGLVTARKEKKKPPNGEGVELSVRFYLSQLKSIEEGHR